MKSNYKKLAIFVLMITVLFSGIFCCCLTDFAQADAEEVLPPCHQAAHADDPAQSTDECECDDALAILDKNSIKSDILETVNLLTFEDPIFSRLHLANFIYHYHAPPITYDSTPIYIKHSILRI